MFIPRIITIDGPAASGKTTLGMKLAEHFNFLFFDTGVSYRALTWMAIYKGIDISDEKAISELAEHTNIDIRSPSKDDGRTYDIWVNDYDATWEIRNPDIEMKVSIISAYPGVRKALSFYQRQIGLRGNVVMVGRDIGTVILPEADIKIFLEASLDERAKRRCEEYINQGKEIVIGEIFKTMAVRDQIDSTRTIAPLKPADDAIIIHTDGLDQDQVFSQIIEIIENKKQDSNYNED